MDETRRKGLSGAVRMAVAAAMFLCSLSVQATLIGNVTARLTATERFPSPTDPNKYVVIDDVSVAVLAGVEFDRVLATPNGIEWTLDIGGDGFSLFGYCTSNGAVGEPQCFDGVDAVISLSLTGMTWQPASLRLVGVDITKGSEFEKPTGTTRDFASSISPTIQPAAMSIEFVLLGLQSLGDSVTVAGRFVTVPEPSVLSLLAMALLGVPLLRMLRNNSGSGSIQRDA